MRVLLAALAAALVATSAAAADLEVSLRSAKGAPAADVVVTVQPARGGAAPAHYDQPLVMSQRGQQFSPFILVVPVGAEVRFPNEDRVKHQVYSFSPAKSFELKLYGREQTRAVRFDKAGVVALGCNIHDAMLAFIDVVDAPFVARTDASGRAVLRGLPAGPVQVRVWHPYLRAPGNALTAQAVLPGAGTERMTLAAELRAPALRMTGY